MSRVALRGAEKRFGRVLAVRGLNLEIRDRELLTLLGPSGCGKSTVLNLVAGLETPTAGRIFIAERDVTALEPHQRDVSMVFQSYALYPHKSVFDNIAFPLQLRKSPPEAVERRVRTVAKRLGIDQLLSRRPAELSGGQRQRVALGRALVRTPSVFLLDEPLSNLDAQLRTETRAEIKRLHDEFGTTTLYVTHDQVEAMSLSDRIAVLKDGALQQVGTPEEIYRRPANRFVAAFVGSPSMSFISAQRVGDRLVLPGMELPLGLEAPERGTVLLGVRPEHIEVGVDAGPMGEVYAVEPLGPHTLVVLDWAGARLTARVPPSFRLRRGDTTRFRFAREHIHLFDPASGKRLGPADPPATAVAHP